MVSDRELAEKLANLQKQLTAAKLANDTGAFFFQQQVDATKFEINRRATFRDDYARKGEAAFLDFSAFDEQTLRQYIRPEDEKRAQQNANNIQTITEKLAQLLDPRG